VLSGRPGGEIGEIFVMLFRHRLSEAGGLCWDIRVSPEVFKARQER